MNLLDLMEEEESAPKPAPGRPPIKCGCPDVYYPQLYADMKVGIDTVFDCLRRGNVLKLNELGVKYYDPADRKWKYWTSYALREFLKTARPFPKCNRSRGDRDP